MYSKQQASQLRQEFWTVFGQYMAPIPSAEGEKINWVNYKTEEKYIFFKMITENRSASIGIEITHPDLAIQQLYYEQFIQLKPLLQNALKEEWEWSLHLQDELGKTTSWIYTEIMDASVLNKSQWSKLISFFKPRIIALDLFWSEAKYAFEQLR